MHTSITLEDERLDTVGDEEVARLDDLCKTKDYKRAEGPALKKLKGTMHAHFGAQEARTRQAPPTIPDLELPTPFEYKPTQGQGQPRRIELDWNTHAPITHRDCENGLLSVTRNGLLQLYKTRVDSECIPEDTRFPQRLRSKRLKSGYDHLGSWDYKRVCLMAAREQKEIEDVLAELSQVISDPGAGEQPHWDFTASLQKLQKAVGIAGLHEGNPDPSYELLIPLQELGSVDQAVVVWDVGQKEVTQHLNHMTQHAQQWCLVGYAKTKASDWADKHMTRVLSLKKGIPILQHKLAGQMGRLYPTKTSRQMHVWV